MSFGFGFGFPSWRTLAGGFSPAALFVGGVQGAWYDPSDLSTMFDTSAGTTPVAMPGLGAPVPVGLMLDKSQGLVLGPNLAAVLPTPTILDSGGSVGVWDGSTQTISSTTITAITNYPRYQFAIAGVTAGKNYQISVTATGTNLIRISNPSLGGVVLTANFASGTLSFIANNVASNVFQLVTDSRAVYSATLTVSIRELPGNHAIAFNNTTARPELRARVNLLEYSEQFNNAYWSISNLTVNATNAIAPDGTATAYNVASSGVSSSNISRDNISAVVIGSSITLSVFAKAGTANIFRIGHVSSLATGVWFNLSTGQKLTEKSGVSGTITPVGNGWYKCTSTLIATSNTSFTYFFGPSDADNSTAPPPAGQNMFFWGADLRPANIGANVPAYQRISDALTYDTSGFPLYLFFTADDSMYTPANLNLSGTDKVSVFAGVRKLSDAAIGTITELSANASTTNGTFQLRGPATNGAQNYYATVSGTSVAEYLPATFAAPITNVVSSIMDIAGASISTELIPRVNGVVKQDSPSGTAGTGNFGTYPLYIGARNNSTFWFNGHLYSLAVVGSAVSAGNIAAMESWVAGRTGIQI